MASTGTPHAEAPDDETRWRTAGDRIQVLLDASAGSGTLIRERTEQLAAELTELYGAALERMMSIAADSAPELVHRFAADELVASLLLVHGLHPHGVRRRIEDALDGVRPYLGSHGGDVTLLDVIDDADGAEGMVVRLQFAGSCKSCPSSAVTLEYAVEDAIRAAAPELTAIEVVAAPDQPAQSVIPADTLMGRIRSRDNGSVWHPAPDLGDLTSGEVGGFLVAGVSILACRLDSDLFAYHDRCGHCGESMAGAVLHRPVGAPLGSAVLRCPRCHAHFDAVHAGAGLDGSTAHLEPIPLLLRDGVLSVAVHAEATGVL